MRRRREFSDNVRSVDNLPHIARQRSEKEQLLKESQHRHQPHFYDKLNMNNQIPYNKIESISQFDKFIDLQKMQFARINNISQNYLNSGVDTPSSNWHSSDTYNSRATTESSITLYIPERKQHPWAF